MDSRITMELLKGIVDGSQNPVTCVELVQKDGEDGLRFVLYNEEFEKAYGVSAQNMDDSAVSFKDLEEMNQNDALSMAILEVYKTGKPAYKTLELDNVNKTYRLKAFVPCDGFICVILTDVTDFEYARKTAQEKIDEMSSGSARLKYEVDMLTASSKQIENAGKIHEMVANACSDGFYYKNYNDGTFFASENWYDLFTSDGVRPFDSKNIINAISDSDVFEFSRWREKAIMQRQETLVCEFRLSDNATWLEASYRFIYVNNKLSEEIGFFKDITTMKLQKEELAYKAYYDATTGLMNRTYFTKILDDEVIRAKKEDVAVCLLYIDIDDFKNLNDSIGYKMADDFIIKFSMMLKSYENESTKVARFDSDEFVISIYDGTRSAAQSIAMDIKKRLQTPMVLANGLTHRLTVSIGITMFPDGGSKAVDLIGNADIALHRVKENGKNAILFFEQNMLEQFLVRIEMENTIKRALEDDRFVLYYQPQYYTATRKLRGMEALIRMRDDVLGFIGPTQFIPLAEKNGTIVEIGEWVLRKAFEDYIDWKDAYDFDGILSINISPIQFKQITFESTLYSLIHEFGIKPDRVEIEITESVFIDSGFQLVEMIKRIRNNGIRVSLDDFGTGYSSLAYLKSIPVDTLKIDKSFVASLGEMATSDIITSSLIEMIQKLGLEIIAEGVETQEQFEFLKKIHCDDIQGFYLARPMSSDSVRAVIREEKC